MSLRGIYIISNPFLKFDRIFRIFVHHPLPSGFHTASGQEPDRRVLGHQRNFLIFLTKIYLVCASLRAVFCFCRPPFEPFQPSFCRLDWQAGPSHYIGAYRRQDGIRYLLGPHPGLDFVHACCPCFCVGVT